MNPNTNVPIDADLLASLREDAEWESNFHDHRVSEDDWETAATALAYAEATAPESFTYRAGRPLLLGALAFAAYCEANLDPDEWRWHRDLREDDRLHHEAYCDVLIFTVGGRRTVVFATPNLFEAANPLHVYGHAEAFDADLHIGGVVDDDEAHVTLYAATPPGAIREKRNEFAHVVEGTREELDARMEALMDDDPLPEHILLDALPGADD